MLVALSLIVVISARLNVRLLRLKLRLPLCLPYLPVMSDTKAGLMQRPAIYGEKPPSSWTVLQLRSRLHECKEAEKLGKVKTLESELSLLKKATQKKAKLVAFLRDYKMDVSENKTVNQLFNEGVETIAKLYATTSKETVNFGKYGYLTYRHLQREHPAYCEWVVKTSKEADSLTGGSSDWLLG